MSRDRQQKIREILFEKKLNPNNPADWEVIMSGRAPNPDSPDGKYMAVDKSGNVYFTDSPGADRVFTDEKGRTYRPSDPSTGRGGKYRPTRKYITVKTTPDAVEEEPPVVPVLVPPTPKPTPVPPSPKPKPTPKPPEDAYIDIKDPDQIIKRERTVQDPAGFNWVDLGQNALDTAAYVTSFIPGWGRRAATVLQGVNMGIDATQAGFADNTEEMQKQLFQAGARGVGTAINWLPAGKTIMTMAPILAKKTPLPGGKFAYAPTRWTLGKKIGGGALGQIDTVNVRSKTAPRGWTPVSKLSVPLNPVAKPNSTSYRDPAFSARPEDLPFGLSKIFGKRAAGYQKGWQQAVAKYRPQTRESEFDPRKFPSATGLTWKDLAFPRGRGGPKSLNQASWGRGVSPDVIYRAAVPAGMIATHMWDTPGPERTETETTVIPGQTRRIRIPGGGGAGNAGVSPEPAASDEGGMQLYRQGSNYFVAPDYEPSSTPEPVLQYPIGGGGEPQPAFGYPDATQGRYPADPNTWEGLPTVSAQRMRMGPSRGRQYSLSMGGFGG